MRVLRLSAVALTVALLAGCSGQGGTSIVLATTTSTQDSGLLDELVPRFTEETGIGVKTIAVGSGQAIELASRGEADVVLVHSPDAEEDLVAEGTTGRRLLVMHNDFVLVGPEGDLAVVVGTPVEDAFATVASSGSAFVSRGDDSGTHAKELGLWADAGTEPGGDWYVETGQGMAATLRVASERGAPWPSRSAWCCWRSSSTSC